MKPKKALFAGLTAFFILLLLLTGCRRFGRTNSASSRPAGIFMSSETQQAGNSESLTSDSSRPMTSETQQTGTGESSSTAVSQTVTSPETQPADSKEVSETLDQILSELTGLDSLYTQMDGVSETDFNN